MQRAIRRILMVVAVVIASVAITGQSGGSTKQPAAQKKKASAAVVARVQPPKPFHSMTLREKAAFQERALRVYVSRWRFWQTHRARLMADVRPLEVCGGTRAPHWACWSYRASIWTRRELDKTQAQRLSALRRTTVQVLRRGLAGSPMAGSEEELERAGFRYHVSPYFIAAIAATESSLGRAMCGSFNAYGLANCGGIWNVPAFRSWGDSYLFMAKYLSERWPGARTPYDFHRYAACDSCWGRKTSGWMQSLFGVGQSVIYAPSISDAL